MNSDVRLLMVFCRPQTGKVSTKNEATQNVEQGARAMIACARGTVHLPPTLSLPDAA